MYDLSKKYGLSCVPRYYYHGGVYESVEDLDAASLSNMIIPGLEKYGLEYKIHHEDRGYNGSFKICADVLQLFFSRVYIWLIFATEMSSGSEGEAGGSAQLCGHEGRRFSVT